MLKKLLNMIRVDKVKKSTPNTISGNVPETENKPNSGDIITGTDEYGPFTLIQKEDGKWVAALGRYMMTQPASKTQTIKTIEAKEWGLLLDCMSMMAETIVLNELVKLETNRVKINGNGKVKPVKN